MERMAQIIKVKPEVIPEYKRIHAAVWPEILKAISDSNIRNYTIFLKEPENILFAYWEYHGTNFKADMEKIKKAPRMREWWDITDPMQVPYDTRKPGDWWASDGKRFPYGLVPLLLPEKILLQLRKGPLVDILLRVRNKREVVLRACHPVPRPHTERRVVSSNRPKPRP